MHTKSIGSVFASFSVLFKIKSSFSFTFDHIPFQEVFIFPLFDDFSMVLCDFHATIEYFSFCVKPFIIFFLRIALLMHL